jgi:hypothetical protein
VGRKKALIGKWAEIALSYLRAEIALIDMWAEKALILRGQKSPN